MGLSIPYYNGKLLYPKESNTVTEKSNDQLHQFYQHLTSLLDKNKLCSLDLNSFKADLEKGIFLSLQYLMFWYW